jgi:hypothetical protein
MFGKLVLLGLAMLFGGPRAWAGSPPPDSFNGYVLKGIEELTARQSNSGYDIHEAYAQPVTYGGGALKPTDPPMTMCVAAMAELIVVAINSYVKATGDQTPYSYLPIDGWNRMRPNDIRSHIWVDPRLGSNGTADSLVTFGIGKRVAFKDLTPGSFINLNRTARPGGRPTGHAVAFLAFLDKDGNELAEFGPTVSGFKYFSANGSGRFPNGGFYSRHAFFNKPNGTPYCPNLPGKKIDCYIMKSESQKLLNAGYMLMPTKWDAAARDKNLGDIRKKLFDLTQTRGPTFLNIQAGTTFEKFVEDLNQRDTMVLNPIFSNSE